MSLQKVMSITTGASKKVVKVILTIVNSTSMIGSYIVHLMVSLQSCYIQFINFTKK